MEYRPALTVIIIDISSRYTEQRSGFYDVYSRCNWKEYNSF